MRTILACVVMLCAAGCAHKPAAGAWTDGVAFNGIPTATGMKAAWLAGSQNAPGLYTIRVQIAADGVMPPHTHPDDRMITVVSGVLHYGFGDKADPAATKAYPAGSFFMAPGNQPHYAIGLSGEAVYQEAGMAPTGTRWVAD
jgi:quercetin dioxygenase-like cupin family protein